MEYTLYWLDKAVTLLNPNNDDFIQPSKKDAEVIVSRARQEIDAQKVVIKNLVFSFFEKRKIRVLVGNYHRCLVLLLDRAYENQVTGQALSEAFQSSCQAVSEAIKELLGFTQERFGDLIGVKDRVPTAYLITAVQDIQARVKIFEVRLQVRIRNKELTGIILHALHRFTTAYRELKVTFQDVRYKKELVTEIEKLILHHKRANLHDLLVERLICLNFNSRAFMNYYTRRVAREVKICPTDREKLDCLLLHFKRFRQMHLKPGVCLNPDYDGAGVVIGNWFAAEIDYLKFMLARQVEGAEPLEARTAKSKTKVDLTVDQVAVAVRALVDIKVLEAGSVSQAFKLLVPHLSTSKRKDVSWNSMRRKAYQVEDVDKSVVVAVLEKAIGAIKNY